MTLGQTTEVMILLKALQWGRVDLNEESFLRKDHQSEPDSRSISSTLSQETLTENSSLTFLLKNLLKLGTLSLNLAPFWICCTSSSISRFMPFSILFDFYLSFLWQKFFALLKFNNYQQSCLTTFKYF
jgi:hypothetical protein